MSRYVITGGSGFLGTELIKQLQYRGEQSIIVLDIVKPKEKIAFHHTDLASTIDFIFTEDDILIHLAARQYHEKIPCKNRQAFFEDVNTVGTEKLLEKSFHDGCRNMLFFSTDMVYGKPQYLPIKEDHPLLPFGYYGKSKKLAEDICRKFRTRGYNITIFRPRLIIGKGRLGILKKLFTLIQHNLPVPMIGAGQNCYQMISVHDCARAALLAVEHGFPNKEYNLGSANPPTVKALLSELARQVNSHSMMIPTNGPIIKGCLGLIGKIGLEIMYKEQYMIADENYILDISQAEQDLRWTPHDSDESMITEAYRSAMFLDSEQ